MAFHSKLKTTLSRNLAQTAYLYSSKTANSDLSFIFQENTSKYLNFTLNPYIASHFQYFTPKSYISLIPALKATYTSLFLNLVKNHPKQHSLMKICIILVQNPAISLFVHVKAIWLEHPLWGFEGEDLIHVCVFIFD